jgi:hypothetical protein
MKSELLLYTRKDCGLCEEMKQVVQQVAGAYPLTIREIDIDQSVELQETYGNEVPVLFIDGRKAFRYRVRRNELEKRLKKRHRGT